MAPVFSLIKDIDPSKMPMLLILKLRLIRVYEVPTYGNNSETFSLECVFHDKDGDRIHATVRKQQIKKFQSLLKESHIYAVKNFILAENNMKYKTTSGKYTLIFVLKTHVTEIFDSNFPKMMYDFKAFDVLTSNEDVDDSFLIDIIGRLAAKDSPQHKEIGGRETKLIDIILEDPQGNTLNCTLWGDFVDELMSYLGRAADEPIIIIMQMCRAKKFKGETRISNTYYVTRMIINGKEDEISDFRDRVTLNGSISTPISYLSSATRTIEEEFDSTKNLLKTIEQIIDSQDVGSFWVYAKIVAVETGCDWWYISCTKCPRKMTKILGELYCENCDNYDAVGQIRYKIKIRVVDITGNAALLLWDRECKELIGKSAFDLRMRSDEKGVPDEIRDLVDMKVLFKVQVRSGQIGVQNVVYTVVKFTLDDALISKFCPQTLESQESDIFSKLKSKDLEDGEEICSSEDDATTPLKNSKNEAIITEGIGLESTLKRSLIDEFSSTAKNKKFKIEVKEEKD